MTGGVGRLVGFFIIKNPRRVRGSLGRGGGGREAVCRALRGGGG